MRNAPASAAGYGHGSASLAVMGTLRGSALAYALLRGNVYLLESVSNAHEQPGIYLAPCNGYSEASD